jgi:asparagine synthase (glutamine-hydrolysing)
MCGIASLFAYRASASLSLEELRHIRDHMSRRGPDGSGEWVSADRRVMLGHRRLAIIDLSERASQPMHSADGRFSITFNGEIYNYKALRARLEHKGHVFRTTSDTEVILQLYAAEGLAMLPQLRGMFAFALWDALEERLLLARDPYGIKPLYYADGDGIVRAASQVRALLEGGGISRARDAAADAGFLLWGSVPEPFTAYRAVRAVPAGSYVLCSAAGVSEPVAYWSIARVWADACENAADSGDGQIQALVRAALDDSVEHHMVADVPVGAFLSGGVDSGALVGLMTEQGVHGTHAITIGFEEYAGRPDDEVPLASISARQYGVVHHVRRVGQAEFIADLPAIFEAMDQPTIDGVNTWFVSKAASEGGLKVAISGVGGDELFAGYPSFEDIPKFLRAGRLGASLPPSVGPISRRILAPMSERLGTHPKLAGVLEYGGTVAGAYLLKRGLFMPWELPTVMNEERAREGLARLHEPDRVASLLSPEPATMLAKIAALEGAQYLRNQLLRDTDWASMYHSLEVRTPLVDHVLLERLAPAIAHMERTNRKAWLAQSPQQALSPLVWHREKTGFTTPIATWMAEAPELDAYRQVPSLAREGVPWARRYAYAVLQQFV